PPPTSHPTSDPGRTPQAPRSPSEARLELLNGPGELLVVPEAARIPLLRAARVLQDLHFEERPPVPLRDRALEQRPLLAAQGGPEFERDPRRGRRARQHLRTLQELVGAA